MAKSLSGNVTGSRFSSIFLLLIVMFLIYLNNSGKLKMLIAHVRDNQSLPSIFMGQFPELRPEDGLPNRPVDPFTVDPSLRGRPSERGPIGMAEGTLREYRLPTRIIGQ